MRIVIVGAGYAGLSLARSLAWWLGSQHAHEILLLDACPCHQLIVRMHEVAAASIPPADAVLPIPHLLRGRRVTFRQSAAVGLDLDAGCVQTPEGPLPFDYLVVAPGGDTEYFGLPGVREHSLPLRTLPDALRIGRHVEGQVVRARREADPERRRARLTFVMGGGGYTGVELAAELVYRVRELRALHEVQEPARILILEARGSLMPGFPAEFSSRAAEILTREGVEVRFQSPVAAARSGRVVLASGEELATETLVWAGGVRAAPLVAESGASTGLGSRAQVDGFLRWEGRENVFVIGDSALALDPDTGEPLHPSAQLAIQEAERVALNLYRLLNGRAIRPFTPRPFAEVVSLGRRRALAVMAGTVFDGKAGRALKDLSYWRYLVYAGALPLPAATPPAPAEPRASAPCSSRRA